FVLALAPVLLFVGRLRRTLAAPLEELGRSAERIARGEMPDAEALTTGEELGGLSRVFARMALGVRGRMSALAAAAHHVPAGARLLREAALRGRAQAEAQHDSIDQTSAAIDRMERSLAAVSQATDRLADATSSTAASASQVEAATGHVGESAA